jgi:tetratricopeptide (TPR) repeat protein
MSELLEQGIEALSAENYTAAITLFTYLIETEPDPAEAYAWLAWSYYHQQEYDQSVLNSTESLNLQPSWFAHWVRGKAYEQLDDLQSALIDFNLSIDMEPTTSAYSSRGRIYQQLGNLQAALTDFSQSIDMEPTDINYWLRGKIYEEIGELQLAFDDYTSAINLAPSDATNYSSRASIWEKANQYKQAVADYTAAIDLDPVNAYYLQFRAYAYQELGMNSEALTDLLQLRVLDREWEGLEEQIQALQDCSSDTVHPTSSDSVDSKIDLEKVETLDTLLMQLEQLTGLQNVKAEVKKLVNLVRVQQLRRERGLSAPLLSLHLVFTGNPGTGKTTIARLISQIYKALGLLSKGHVVEVDRSGLVAGFVGQTALKVKEVITTAQGGILFIDEAYTLITESSANDFGREAIDTLLKSMEDYRDDFVVIVAGYPNQMSTFLSSNPGLQSRFNKFIVFEDYTIDELCEILNSLCISSSYFLSTSANDHVRDLVQNLVIQNRIAFGNARGVRNLFEQAISAQASRVIEIEDPNEVDLSTLEIADFISAPSPLVIV